MAMLRSATMSAPVLASKSADYYASDRSDFLGWVGGDHSRVLDIGCGTGANGAWYRQHGAREGVGVEVDPASADRASAGLDRVIWEPIETALGMLEGPG